MTTAELRTSTNDAMRQQENYNDIFRQILVIVALVSTVVVNALANIVPFNGQTTGDLSDKYPVLITPAGYVFSIWSLIYIGLLVYAIYQGLPSQRTNKTLRSIGWPFIITCIANSTWIFFWHYERIAIALLIMLVLLVTLIVIYRRLYADFAKSSTIERWTTHYPFRIYLGWITVATIANSSVFLYDQGWRGAPLSESIWTILMILVATAIGLFFALAQCDSAYTSVLVWAYVGIAIANGSNGSIQTVAVASALVLAAAALYSLRQSFTSSRAI